MPASPASANASTAATRPSPSSRSSPQSSIGRDPFAIDALFEEMRRGLVFEGGFAGALITALTGIEIALWDLKGKALKMPDL